MADEKDVGFKVSDRRKFNPDGSLKDEVAQAPAVQAATPEPQQTEGPPQSQAATDNVVSFPAEPAKKKDQQEKQAQAGERQAQTASQAASQAANAYRQVNSANPSPAHQGSLLGLVNMLASEAAMLLGLIESPVEGGIKIDLDSAREVIDLLGLLEQKTRGNLTEEEEKVLEEILAYLRMQYVMASKQK
jgi:hypothetical protein